MLEPALDQQLRDIYATARTIAVVGATTNEDKAGFYIPRYIQAEGYRIVPVTPRYDSVLGEAAYPTLATVDVPVDVVNVFRPSAETPEIARQAVDIGAKVLWLQPGISSDEAEAIGHDAGMVVIMDRCIGRTHAELGLGEGP